MHMRESEPSLSYDRPILSQRSYVRFHEIYCKPLISRGATQWNPGFHTAAGGYTLDPKLFLFNLKAMDYEIAHQELLKKNRTNMTPEAINEGQNIQFRFDKLQYYSLYFQTENVESSDIQGHFDFRKDLSEYLNNTDKSVYVFGSTQIIPERFRKAF